MRQKLKSLAQDAGQLYLAQLVGVAVSFGISVVVARALGADARGAYGWIMSLYFLAMQMALLGTDTLNRKMGATHPDWRPALAGNSVLQAALLGTVMALVMFGYGYMQPVGQAYVFPLMLGLAATPLAALLTLWNALSGGMGHVRVLAASEIIQKLLTVAIVGGVLLLGVFEVWHLLLALVLALLVALLYVGRELNRLLHGEWRVRPKLFRHEAPMIVGAFGASLCMQLMQRVDLLMLAAWRPLADSGHYAIATTLMDALLMLPGAIGFMLLPKLAQDPDRTARLRLLLTVMALVMGATAVVCAVAAWLAPWFIPLLFGAEFADSVPVFQRLLMAGVVIAGFNLCQNAVAGTKRARHVLVAPLAGVLVKVSLGALLVPHGPLAAANVNVLAYGVALLVALVLVVRR